MKLPRTIFGPFALVAALLIGIAIGRIDRPFTTQEVAHAELSKGSKHVDRTVQQRLRARLIVPVRGLTRRDLTDTWGHARSEGRTHQGIDIMAQRGAPVLAVADGRIVKFFDSVRGGVTIYQFDQSERFVYYYAHLDRRAPSLAEGDMARQGDVIGYVGMTGNAPVPHLHFEIQRLTAERHWWEATSMNPYPLLMTGEPPR